MSAKYERMKIEVAKFFPSCPLCQKETIETRFNAGYFARDYIVCSNCQAKWHINFLQGLKWAKLINVSVNGRGGEYLGVENKPTFWFDMVEKKPPEKGVTPQPSVKAKEVVREKEIVREKEVVIKIRCPYCDKLYNEVLDVCPHCGGKR